MRPDGRRPVMGGRGKGFGGKAGGLRWYGGLTTTLEPKRVNVKCLADSGGALGTADHERKIRAGQGSKCRLQPGLLATLASRSCSVDSGPAARPSRRAWSTARSCRRLQDASHARRTGGSARGDMLRAEAGVERPCHRQGR